MTDKYEVVGVEGSMPDWITWGCAACVDRNRLYNPVTRFYTSLDKLDEYAAEGAITKFSTGIEIEWKQMQMPLVALYFDTKHTLADHLRVVPGYGGVVKQCFYGRNQHSAYIFESIGYFGLYASWVLTNLQAVLRNTVDRREIGKLALILAPKDPLACALYAVTAEPEKRKQALVVAEASVPESKQDHFREYVEQFSRDLGLDPV